MPSRRPHQKSRHGCTICKQRRIKCDEGRPECGHCRKIKSSCSFLAESYPQLPPDPRAPQPSSSQGQLSTNDYSLPLLDLQLLHQWYTCTAQKLSDNQDVQRVMTDIIPREGFAHTFLMHGLLAIAALHRVQLDGPKDTTALFKQAAIQHKQKALSLYTPLLSNINKTNCSALYAFSCLLSILSFASQNQSATRTVKDITDVVGILRLIRGVAVIVTVAREWIESSELRLLLLAGRFTHPPSTSNSKTCPSEDEVQLRLLLEHCHTTCKDSRLFWIYLESIEFLLGGYIDYSTTSDNALILAWPIRLDPHFLELLLQKDQLALVIFAHYGAIMIRLEDTWWLRGWGELVISLILDLLAPSELPRITWPLRMAQNQNSSSAAVQAETGQQLTVSWKNNAIISLAPLDQED